MSDPAVAAAALGWVGTPYMAHQRVKGLGVDCPGLPIGVARELGLVAPDFDVTGYGLSPTPTSLVDAMDTYCPRGPVEPGAVIAVRSRDSRPYHLGIVIEHPYSRPGAPVLGWVHASLPKGRVVMQRLLFGPSLLLVAAWRLPGAA